MDMPSERPAKLVARVSRGKNQGKELRPHKYSNGKFVASKTRFEQDYVFVDSEYELLSLMQQGYRVRMSGDGVPPSLIAPKSIRVE